MIVVRRIEVVRPTGPTWPKWPKGLIAHAPLSSTWEENSLARMELGLVELGSWPLIVRWRKIIVAHLLVRHAYAAARSSSSSPLWRTLPSVVLAVMEVTAHSSPDLPISPSRWVFGWAKMMGAPPAAAAGPDGRRRRHRSTSFAATVVSAHRHARRRRVFEAAMAAPRSSVRPDLLMGGCRHDSPSVLTVARRLVEDLAGSHGCRPREDGGAP
ncbi:hypothetical protein ACLOJK_011509 [Asimina triloba]